MLDDCRDVCDPFPWLRQLYLLDSDRSPATLLALTDGPPRSVAPGQRKRLLGQLQARSPRPLQLRLATRRQLDRWLSHQARFAAAFRNARRLYQRED